MENDNDMNQANDMFDSNGEMIEINEEEAEAQGDEQDRNN